MNVSAGAFSYSDGFGGSENELFECLETTSSQVSVLVDGFVTTAVAVAGLAGNMAACTQIARLKSCSTLFMALAFCDCSVLLTALGYYSLPTIEKAVAGHNSLLLTYVNHYLTGAAGFSIVAVAWMLVLIMGTQFHVINRPLDNQCLLARQQPMTSALTLAAAALYSVVRCFERELVACERLEQDEASGEWNSTPSLMNMPTALLINEHYYFVYHVVMQFVFVTAGPFLLILMFGLGIVHSLRHRPVILRSAQHSGIRKNDAALRNDSRILHKVSLMVLLTAAKFVCSRLLPLFLNIINEIVWAQERHFVWYKPLVAVSNLLVVMHSATNWLFYLPNPTKAQPPIAKITSLNKYRLSYSKNKGTSTKATRPYPTPIDNSVQSANSLGLWLVYNAQTQAPVLVTCPMPNNTPNNSLTIAASSLVETIV